MCIDNIFNSVIFCNTFFFFKVDENMKVAQKRNAVQEGMFYFRKDVFKG